MFKILTIALFLYENVRERAEWGKLISCMNGFRFEGESGRAEHFSFSLIESSILSFNLSRVMHLNMKSEDDEHGIYLFYMHFAPVAYSLIVERLARLKN